jgi:hypothetical protein
MSDANFTITENPQGNETISIVSPNGGEWWQQGVDQLIRWESSENFSYVRIDYSTDSGRNWSQVTSKTANDGERTWTIPNTPSDSCRLRIRDFDDGDPEDFSDATFTIGSGDPPQRSLTITNPNGGEILEVESLYTITWDHTGSVSDVSIHYSTNNGAYWDTVANRTTNDHRHYWLVPDVGSNSCLIRMWEADSGNPLDISDSVFTITNDLVAPAVDSLYLMNATELVISFTEALEESTAELISNYSIDNGISVFGAILGPSLNEVRLTTTGHTPGVPYTVTIDGVRDRGIPPNTIAEGTTGWYEYNPSGIGEGGENEPATIPKVFSLSQNFPNPFNPSTSITFAIPDKEGGSETVLTRLTIYNLKGQLIRRLFEGYLKSGYHTITWGGRDETGMQVGSGIYIYRLEADGYAFTRKMILVK